MRATPNVFTIDPGQPFLPLVVRSLCSGELVNGFRFSGDPLCLADVTIFVPTQRAARELRSAFLDYLGAESVLLPRIRALGEFEEESVFFEGDPQGFIATPPPIDGLERQLLLGGLIADWNKHLNARLRALYQEEELTTPVSTSDAFWLARDLASLLDQLQTEDLTFDDIDRAADGLDADGWWGVTQAFLQIIAAEWPAKLNELKRLDPAKHRNLMLRGEAKRLEKAQPTTPVLVVGSTGTIPATADLIDTIAKLPAGAVVLPGYDLSMSIETKSQLEKGDELASAVGHPQYGMHHLVLKMGAAGLVERLGAEEISGPTQQRHAWISTALEPAPQTVTWPRIRQQLTSDAFQGVEVLEAANEREEAAAIAAALREAIADPLVKTALVTPDRMLARRVVTELARYGIEADDSGGTPFDASLQGRLMGFAFSSVFASGDAGALLALLKNPLVKLGCRSDQHCNDVMWLERLVMRGGVGRFSLGEFAAFAAKQIALRDRPNVHKPRWWEHVTQDDRSAAIALAERLQNASKPLTDLAAGDGEVRLEDVLKATVLVLEALCADERRDHNQLYDGQSGTMLRQLLTQFLASNSGLKFEANQWPEIVRSLTASILVKPDMGGHPRVSIWGALEARLQTVDFLVMGGLNEGVWPSQPTNDAFLSRGLKFKMNMQQPERRIGLASHDFQMGMGQKRVLLTRSVRLDNAPSVSSRWLQRLQTLAGGDAAKSMRAKGQRFVKIVEATQNISHVPLAVRPAPTPPLEARPNHFSVTEIEKLRRDPYAIYAKKVLGLYPAEPLVRDPDAASRGTLFHKILETITERQIDFQSTAAPEQMRQIASEIFKAENLPEDIEVIWQLRFDSAIDHLAVWEAERSARVAKRLAERLSDKIPVGGTGVTLSGRADRLDQNEDGSIDIVDFKTGGVPSAKQVHAMLAPQMPLEAALIERGAFPEIGEREPKALLYVTLDAKGNVKESDVRKKGKDLIHASELASAVWDKLIDILSFYTVEENGYISRAIPAAEREASIEYDHLARVLEWSSAIGDNEAGDGG